LPEFENKHRFNRRDAKNAEKIFNGNNLTLYVLGVSAVSLFFDRPG
jgi:hypothetical protein